MNKGEKTYRNKMQSFPSNHITFLKINNKMASNGEDRISCNSKPGGSDDSDDSGNDPDSSVSSAMPAPSSQEIKCLKDQVTNCYSRYEYDSIESWPEWADETHRMPACDSSLEQVSKDNLPHMIERHRLKEKLHHLASLNFERMSTTERSLSANLIKGLLRALKVDERKNVKGSLKSWFVRVQQLHFVLGNKAMSQPAKKHLQ